MVGFVMVVFEILSIRWDCATTLWTAEVCALCCDDCEKMSERSLISSCCRRSASVVSETPPSVTTRSRSTTRSTTGCCSTVWYTTGFVEATAGGWTGCVVCGTGAVVPAGARSKVTDRSGGAESGDCEFSTLTDTSPQSEKSGQISRYRAEAVRCRKEGRGDVAAAAKFARTAPIRSPAAPEVTANDSEATRQTATSHRAISRPRLPRFGRSLRIDLCSLKRSRGSRAGMHFSITRDASAPVSYQL